MNNGNPTYSLITYGCQMNEHDSEILAGILQEMGYRKARVPEEADLILLNTCCVRESAERKVYGKIGELKRLKQRRPDLIIGVCGCMTQQKDLARRMSRRAPHVDLIIGTHNLHELPRLLEEVKECRGEPRVEVWESESELVENLPAVREEGVRAWVTIMYGCNNYCAYCIVPYVRGRERSRRPEDITREVEELGRRGFKEVTLLGQNVNAYGRDLEGDVDFADLLARLDTVPGVERIRYTTSHPRDFNQKMIDVVAASRKVCEHFHLPVQAGSNETLRRMNRGYTREQYLELAAAIRGRIPGASITTDIIVGFPGETEEQFAETLDLVRRVEFDNAFTFMYSPRSGTAAARMPEQLPLPVKKDRLQRLMEVQYPITRRKNEAPVGETVELLVEGTSKANPARLTGRTRTNRIVLFPGDAALAGEMVMVEITSARTWTLEGRVKTRGSRQSVTSPAG